jgi:hypothetical protein
MSRSLPERPAAPALPARRPGRRDRRDRPDRRTDRTRRTLQSGNPGWATLRPRDAALAAATLLRQTHGATVLLRAGSYRLRGRAGLGDGVARHAAHEEC